MVTILFKLSVNHDVCKRSVQSVHMSGSCHLYQLSLVKSYQKQDKVLFSLANDKAMTSLWLPVASFAKEVNPRLAKRPLVFNGHLANFRLTSFVKEAKGYLYLHTVTGPWKWVHTPYGKWNETFQRMAIPLNPLNLMMWVVTHKQLDCLTHCGLVTLYDVTQLGQHWSR